MRYKSGLLWRTADPNLPNNFFAAQRRFFNLERKFAKNEGLAVVYKNVINTYIDYGHARKLTKKEIDNGPPGRTWYNSHYPVFNPNKPERAEWCSTSPINIMAFNSTTSF
jgi:hypothetical protein